MRLCGSPLRSIPCYLTTDPQDTFHISHPNSRPHCSLALPPASPQLSPLSLTLCSQHCLLPALFLPQGPLHKWSLCLMCLGKSCFLRNSSLILTLADGASGKEPACQCRGCKSCGFSPWVRKIPWRRTWQLTPVFLPGESHGQRSLEGCSPRGCRESDVTQHACRWLKKIRFYLLLLSPLDLFIIPGADLDTSRSFVFQSLKHNFPGL